MPAARKMQSRHGYRPCSLPRNTHAPSKPWYPAQATAQEQQQQRTGRSARTYLNDPVCFMPLGGRVPSREVQ